MWTDLPAEVVDLVGVQTDRVGQLVRGALAKPQPPRAQPERGQRLDQRDLGRLREVERAAHRGADGARPENLVFRAARPSSVWAELTSGNAGVESFETISESPV